MACRTCNSARIVTPGATPPPPPGGGGVYREGKIPKSPFTVEPSKGEVDVPDPNKIYKSSTCNDFSPIHQVTEEPPVHEIGTIDIGTIGQCGIDITPKDKPCGWSDVGILPTEAPPVEVLRSETFFDSLVEVEAAAVVAGFGKPKKSKCIQDLLDECEACNTDKPEAKCFNPRAKKAHHTHGYELPHQYLDAKPTLKMVVLGRVGRCLARLFGEGALWQNADGTVELRKYLPLRAQHLFHQWFQPTPTSRPIIGAPLPFSYQFVSDLDGNPFLQRGLAEEDSITVWSHEASQFEQRPVTGFPICVRKKIESAPAIELVGFEPLSPLTDPETLRCLKKISGEGIIHFRTVQAPPTPVCSCDECEPTGAVADTTTIAEFIPNPPDSCSTDECPWILGFVNGAPRWINPSDVECLRGAPGMNGTNGNDGDPGQDGTILTYNNCGTCPPAP